MPTDAAVAAAQWNPVFLLQLRRGIRPPPPPLQETRGGADPLGPPRWLLRAEEGRKGGGGGGEGGAGPLRRPRDLAPRLRRRCEESLSPPCSKGSLLLHSLSNLFSDDPPPPELVTDFFSDRQSVGTAAAFRANEI